MVFVRHARRDRAAKGARRLCAAREAGIRLTHHPNVHRGAPAPAFSLEPPMPKPDFRCVRCGHAVATSVVGTRHRNHCPRCLWSMHLDDHPGDRVCPCRSPMEPIAIEVRRDGEWAIVHRCAGCGLLRTNRIAGDDHEMSLLALALRPLSRPAFPLDAFEGSG